MITIRLPEDTAEKLDPDVLAAMTFVVNGLVGVRMATEYASKKKTIFFNPEKKVKAALDDVSNMLNNLTPLQKTNAAFLLMGWSRGEIKMEALKGDYTKEANMLVKAILKLTGSSNQRELSVPELNKMYVEMGIDLIWPSQS